MIEPLEIRVLRIEEILGIKNDLSIVGGSEFWIVQGDGSRGDRSLNYWGPYPTKEAAVEDNDNYRPHFGHVIVEVPK